MFIVCTLGLQVNVLAVEYPGYGICPGGQVQVLVRANLCLLQVILWFEADELSVTENARLAFRFTTEAILSSWG